MTLSLEMDCRKFLDTMASLLLMAGIMAIHTLSAIHTLLVAWQLDVSDVQILVWMYFLQVWICMQVLDLHSTRQAQRGLLLSFSNQLL